MSLISRIAISNVANLYYPEDKDWTPRYRFEVLNFYGQSVALNLTNGGGKTTIVEAMLAILSRDSTFTSNTRSKFSPKASRVMSHFQIEFIVSKGDTTQTDLLVQQGSANNGTRWVFGVCGHYDSESLKFYYYKGCLEDVEIGRDDENGKLSQSDYEFTEQRKNLGKTLNWDPNVYEWKDALKHHISTEAFKQLVANQKQGKEDSSALFDIKGRTGESFTATFFYEVLAPKIMSGIMGNDVLEDDDLLEDSLDITIMSVVTASRKTAAQAEKTKIKDFCNSKLEKVAEKSLEAKKDHHRYYKKLREVSLEVSVLSELVNKKHIIGIPNDSTPDGITGEVAKEVVIEPGETNIRLKDTALVHLLGIEIHRINENANRLGIFGRKLPQAIDITCDIKQPISISRGGVRKENSSYTLDEVFKILDSAPKFARKMTLSDAKEIIDTVDIWFFNTADTNPYRNTLIEKTAERDYYKSEYESGTKKHKTLSAQREELRNQNREFTNNEGLYLELLSSGFYTDKEVETPLKTKSIIIKERASADLSLEKFNTKEAKLSTFINSWKKYTDLHDVADPSIIERSYELKLAQAEKTLFTTKKETKELESNSEQSIAIKNGKEQLFRGAKEKLNTLKKLQPEMNIFKNIYGQDTNPKGLERKLLKENSDLTAGTQQLKKENNFLADIENSIHQFKNTISNSESPAKWLERIESERKQLTSNKDALNSDLKNNKRQLSDLEKESIAATESIQDALNILNQMNIKFRTVHEFILNLEVDKKRQTELLSSFSTVLFSPVFKEDNEAKNALEALYEKEYSIAVYMEYTLQEYCKSKSVKINISNSVFVGIHAGISTRQVECLLDPSLVEKEKVKLKLRIVTVNTEIEIIVKRELEIASEGTQVSLARTAKKAIDDNVVKKLKANEKQIIDNEKELQNLVPLIKESAIQTVRKADEYISLGGDLEHRKLLEEFTQIEKEIEELQLKVKDLGLQIIDSKKKEEDQQEIVINTYTHPERSMISSAKSFWNEGGVTFYTSKDRKYKEIVKNKEKADNRYSYIQNFERVQSYINARSQTDNKKSIDRQITEIGIDIKSTEKAIGEASTKQLNLTETELPNLIILVKQIDEVAQKFMDKYKKVALLSEDVSHYSEVNFEDQENHILWKSCSKLSDSIKENIAFESLEGQLVQFKDSIDSINVDENLQILKRYKSESNKTEKDFIESIYEITNMQQGFAPAEKEYLLKINSIGQLKSFTNFHNEYKEMVIKEVDDLERLQEGEKAIRVNLSRNTSTMILRGAENLKIMKRVVSRDYNNFKSHFTVNANVITADKAKQLVDDLVILVDNEEKHRELTKANQFKSSKKDFKASRKKQIRDQIYRTIFTEPSVKFVNEKMRMDKREHSIEEKLSMGEKSALSIMWTIRLAEFAIEKEAKAFLSPGAKRKVRNRSETIIIIDGLFSTLSDRLLIKSAMSGMEDTRGRFQLIGFIHNTLYLNDFKIFPVFLIGKVNVKPSESDGWVNFKEGKPVEPEAVGKSYKEVNFAELVLTPPTTNDNGSIH